MDHDIKSIQLPAERPLAGVTVVEIGQNVAAPAAGQILGDLGATVVKIEKPSGDDARGWGPPFYGVDSALFHSLNRSKRSVVVDFRDVQQVEHLERYIQAEADVVLQSMRPGLLASHGLTAERLRARKPDLIWCDLGAFGRGGPLSKAPGYDPLMQAFAGLMSVTGEPGRPPVRTGYSVVDVGTGLWAALAIVAALLRRTRTGTGSVVEVSLLETALSWMGTAASQYQADGRIPGQHGSGAASIAPYRAYRAKDAYLVVAAGNDRLFHRLADLLDCPGWKADPRFASNAARVLHRVELDALIEAAIGRLTCADWLQRMEQAGIPVARVQNIEEALSHPQTVALGMLQPAPGDGPPGLGLPVRFDGVRPKPQCAAPSLNDGAACLDF